MSPDDPAGTSDDRKFLFRTFECAASAGKSGNKPYGALLVKNGSILMESENKAVVLGDVTLHAEISLIGCFSRDFGRLGFEGCTLYSSAEPCVMCCGAIYSAGIKRLVYGATATQVRLLRRKPFLPNPLRCREIFERVGAIEIKVVGPLMEKEALATYSRFLDLSFP